MKQRFYFDTSVFGGVYDIEFDEQTIQLFEKVKLGEIICIYSDLTIGESLILARHYIAEKVVGETSFDDCVHIALATIHKADILVSWNFRHIVNVYRIRGYNSVNLRQGYTALEIRSPKDIISYED
jgi:hypothetical protein